MSVAVPHLPGNLNADAEQSTAELVAQRRSSRLGRRRFLSTLGTAGLAAGAAALTGCSDDGPIALPTITPSVLDILNFALNLEYLEASFYLYVSTGSGLSSTDMGSGAGTVTGGAKVNFVNGTIASAAAQLATDEREHVEFLRSTITAVGGTPIPMPNINLAAMGAVTSDATFLSLARQLEGVGSSAYIGGAAYLTSSTQALEYAAQILHLEAQHEAFLRGQCILSNVSSPAVDAQDRPPTSSQIFNTSPTTGLQPVRTTSQVLQIVYGVPGIIGASSGGFFPNGLNGSIRTS
jgi:hypothetical protein